MSSCGTPMARSANPSPLKSFGRAGAAFACDVGRAPFESATAVAPKARGMVRLTITTATPSACARAGRGRIRLRVSPIAEMGDRSGRQRRSRLSGPLLAADRHQPLVDRRALMVLDGRQEPNLPQSGLLVA